ncbi:MAG: hypothetical protein COA92_00590 [Sulfurovum sp.]|nr:MAG: hypothetical protein COA92_00590 [Sulfurovum sp.]
MMEAPEIHVEELKKDTEFLANIKKLEEECKKEQSIAKGYQLLDAQLIIEAPEEEINEIFTFIVNSAFDRLAEKLSKAQKFNVEEEEDKATARAIYEHGMQRYSENDKKGAKEIFLILSHSIDKHSLKDAMLLHAAVVISGKSFDDFIDNIVDVSKMDENDPLAFFVQTFSHSISEMFELFDKEVQEAREEIRIFAKS